MRRADARPPLAMSPTQTARLQPRQLDRRLRGEHGVVPDQRDIGLEASAAGQFDDALQKEWRRLLLGDALLLRLLTASAMRSSIIACSSA